MGGLVIYIYIYIYNEDIYVSDVFFYLQKIWILIFGM